jgi:hypothetical protein
MQSRKTQNRPFGAFLPNLEIDPIDDVLEMEIPGRPELGSRLLRHYREIRV